MGRTVAFFSYTRFDNEAEQGRLADLHSALQNALAQRMGERDLIIFRDEKHLEPGQEWSKRIDGALAGASLLIPVVTPSYFSSGPCMEELQKFRKRQQELGRGDLVMPIYWIKDRLLEAGGALDEARAFMSARQWMDWRMDQKKRGLDALHEPIHDLAEKMADRLHELQTALAAPQQTPPPKPEAKPAPPMPAPPKLEAAPPRIAPKPGQPELIVDATKGPYREIQDAIDAAPEGALIRVRPGPYKGIRVTKSI